MLDIIGKLYDIDNSDPDNPVSTLLDGYHVNTTHKIKGADDYLTEPSTPRRVFAGAVTHSYVFADEYEAKKILGYDEELGYTPNFEPELIPAPTTITARQARLALAHKGLLFQVEQALENIEDDVQRQLANIEWEYAGHIERNASWLVALSDVLGLSKDEVDNLFRLASTL